MTDTENPSRQPESSDNKTSAADSAIPLLLQRAASQYGGRTFLLERGENAEYSQIDCSQFLAKIHARARYLSVHGVVPGDTVGLCHTAWQDFIYDCFAVWTLEATVVSLPAEWRVAAIQSHLQQSGARFLCCSDSVRAKLEPVWSGLDFLEGYFLPEGSASEWQVIPESQKEQQQKQDPKRPQDSQSKSGSQREWQPENGWQRHSKSQPGVSSKEAVHSQNTESHRALFAYTAGTEGDPLGVLLSGASLAGAALALNERFADTEISALRILGQPGDLHGLVGGVLLAIHRGASVSFGEGRTSEVNPQAGGPSSDIERRALAAPNFLIGRMSQCQSWLAQVESFTGTVVAIHDDSMRNAPSWPSSNETGSGSRRIFYSYGLCESSGFFALKQFRPGSESGYAALDGSVRIGAFQSNVDDKAAAVNEANGEGNGAGPVSGGDVGLAPGNDGFVDAPDGTVGEIWIQCDYLAEGFAVQSSEHGHTQFIRGWLCTGDLGYKKGEELFVVSRAGERIVRADAPVYAPEVEGAILSLEGVQDCAVVGMKDAKLGQEVFAFVVLEAESSLDARQIKNALRSYLVPEKLPGKLEIVSSLPYNLAGKLQKNRLAYEFQRNQKLLNRLPGQVDIPYQWVYGKALSRFYTGLREEEKIYGTICPVCKKVQVPPKVYCGICFVECTEFVEVPRTGVLESFTTVHLEYPGQPRKPPYTYGYIKLDGSHTHLYHLVDGLSVDDIRTGMRVEAVWKPRSERKGTLYDIQYFQPVE